MLRRPGLVLLLVLVLAADRSPAFQLHPENPRHFLFRGRPTVIVTSGEHYGAVVNADFDFRRYLDTLAKDGLNGTRVFSGTYVETGGNFGINANTLDPSPGRFLGPWARGDQPGYADGGNKFDLMRFDPAYFARLRGFVAHAGQRGVVVEVVLFCPLYEDSMWRVSPMNAANNVNGLGSIPRQDVLTLGRSGGLLAVQEAVARKIVAELRGFDNVSFEICNEPYAVNPPVPDDWQRRMTDVVADAMKDWPRPALISWNIANQSAKVENPHPAVSLFNFHYATPPDAVAMNRHLKRPIGDNETGFRGTNDAPYRMEAWDFLIAGGALFNHLDYSFAVGHEDGTFVYPATQPGGGNPTLRRQLGFLGQFMRGLDVVRMAPDDAVIAGGIPDGGTARALVEPGRTYAMYLRKAAATGPFSVRWSGSLTPAADGEHLFHTTSNDGVRLDVDGRRIIDHWTDHGATEDTGRATLRAGQPVPVVLEYFYNGGQGVIALAWTPPGDAKAIVPTGVLRPPDGGAPGLRGEYFRGRDLAQPWRTRHDVQVNFPFGTKSPFEAEGAGADTSEPLKLRLPAGRWTVEVLDPVQVRRLSRDRVRHDGGEFALPLPAFAEDLAVKISAQ
ncbi:MAG: PA14 domain-containing protein [Limisphaerales bacterium]